VVAAKDLGWDAAVVDHDALERGDFMTAVKRVMTASDDAVYRGWMVRSENYVGLEAALKDTGVVLRTTGEVYKRAHELPGWYPSFRSLTALSVWLSGGGTEGLLEIVKQLPPGRAVLKDWVKSMKHYWAEAAFIPDLSDEEAVLRVAERFLELRERISSEASWFARSRSTSPARSGPGGPTGSAMQGLRTRTPLTSNPMTSHWRLQWRPRWPAWARISLRLTWQGRCAVTGGSSRLGTAR
jgi:hypothetical protein